MLHVASAMVQLLNELVVNDDSDHSLALASVTPRPGSFFFELPDQGQQPSLATEANHRSTDFQDDTTAGVNRGISHLQRLPML
jgi:hypothetical protein